MPNQLIASAITLDPRVRAQLDHLDAQFEDMKATGFRVSDAGHTEFITRCLATAARLSGDNSQYVIELRRLIQIHSARLNASTAILYAVIRALACDLENGFCQPKDAK